MFRRTLTALAVAVGVAAGATLATPALAAGPPVVTQSSATPAHHHHHHHHPHPRPPYPASVPTFTAVWAPPTSGNRPAQVFVSVFSGAGTPSGLVTITVAGRTQTLALHHGGATARIRGLAPGTYPVSVRYTPTAGSRWKASSGSATLFVLATQTRTHVNAPPIRVGQVAAITARVTAQGPARPEGSVRFTVGGRTLVATLHHGAATVSVPGLRAGTYLVTATFTPSSTGLLGSSDQTTLTVRQHSGGPHGVSFRPGSWHSALGWGLGGRSGYVWFA
ncbi:Ig-like domain-containing protein [Cellulomonas alba]|uniref:Ig-like domain-containing protein n=1 Tax=Cellulomonas alba TaxID=3053467 RepID=A0ABT7SH05_9CELL|nr:Ig-like domain-containing protein [Cellulomonas alba]MDM7855461.1 Ig-like domain-containing protein [Cellulomonas alba]